jgi:chlorobactene glucosyltransferase
VVDDHSTDGTPDIVARLARREPRLRLVLSPRLPPSWTGKSHACWIGARTIGTVADWICFVDADMRAEPNLLTAAVEAAQADRIDLLSVTPRQVLGSFAERLIIPNGLFILAFLQGVASQPAGDGGDVTATGQFMLVRAERYAAVGGHAAVRSAICEDLELARRCRRAGGKVRLADGAVLLCGRMYTGWRTLWPGFAKNLVDMFGGPGATAATALISIMLAWAAPLVPALALWACIDDPGRISVLSLVCAALASAAMWSLHVAGAIYFRIPAWFGLLFPLGYTLGALIAADSMRRRWQGRVTWKGRVYS